MERLRGCNATALLIGFLYGHVCHAHPTVTLGEVVPVDRQIDVDRIDHSSWDALLKKYVDDAGFVDYTGWKGAAADVGALDGYLSRLSAAKFTGTSTREARLAFWINAYNAITVRGILREYPTTSIRNHTAKVYGYNIWKDLQLPVAGQAWSLDAIEHQVLRKMGEPRIHFAIVCASKGCPRLLNEAYTAQRVDEQLTANAVQFFSDSAKFAANADSGTVQVSPILKWFGEDFGGDPSAQLKSIAPYLPETHRKLALSGRARVTYLDYDWGLNDRAGRPVGGRR